MTKEKFVTIALEKYEKMNELDKISDFYQYEKAFDSIWTKFGRQSFEKKIEDVPQNHQKKTVYEPGTEK